MFASKDGLISTCLSDFFCLFELFIYLGIIKLKHNALVRAIIYG